MDASPLTLILAVSTAISVLALAVLLSRLGRLRDIESQFIALGKSQDKTEKSVREEIMRYREEAGGSSRQLREEINTSVKMLGDSLLSRVSENARIQNTQMESFSSNLSRLTLSNEQKLDRMRETVEEKIALLQRDNNEKLEKMRLTVDEKLHATLEKRLGESFKLVSERLELVHKGLGEMQTLAAGVGDLKKVLSNVKTRGIWGEISLANLLEQVFTADQYQKNVATKNGSNDRVEFAIKLPGRDPDRESIWLPIDAKFPQEDYQRLIEAQEQSNAALADQASRQLEARIKGEAKSIRDKYIDPPGTTDFAIIFLPTEGLFAEVIRRPGLCDVLLRDYRVVVTGPTTLTALLSSLQIGFHTLAIEKRSSEVWALLGAVKTEFGKFSDVLEKTHKKLQEATNTIDTAARKSRTIERKLKGVQELPASKAVELLGEEPF
ncbi:MAG: recombinase RmuC [Peptococcaceae bacterium BICA1-7]|nr:MAG: recombinase RmuC [Peptococcaceae bacterium BICA1-7]HBV98308.1 DNA recombination protein RmuC [Desulfotomaculum sp.]